MAATDVDFSLPAGTLLRIGTKQVHDDISGQDHGIGWLLNGELDRQEYIRYLMMLWHIYSTLESVLEKNSNHPTLSPTFNPALLSRTSRLSADISYLLGIPDDDKSWKVTEVNQRLVTATPEPLKVYLDRMTALGSEDPSRLLAHSYVRYMGDLSGGQIIRWKLQKAYGLNETGGGLTFYEFDTPTNDGGVKKEIASVGEMKKIKELFRSGIDKGAGDDRQIKEALLDETVTAYGLNSGVFSTLTPPSKSKRIDTSVSVEDSKSSFSLASVVAFLLALALAQVFLTTGGYTGEKGLAKLSEPALKWVSEFIGQGSN